MIIRRGTLDDLNSLMKLAKEYHYASRLRRYALWEDSIYGWQHFFSSSLAPERTSIVCFVAIKNKEIVGFTFGLIYPAFWNTSIPLASVVITWVTPGEEEKCKELLFSALEDWAKKHKAVVLTASSSTQCQTKETQKFLLANGFNLAGRDYEKVLKE